MDEDFPYPHLDPPEIGNTPGEQVTKPIVNKPF